MRTKHGIHVHGFPNAFFVQPTQGANLISNVPHNLTEAGKTIAMVVRHALRQAQGSGGDARGGERVGRIAADRRRPHDRALDCTPGYYNNEGQAPGPAARLAVGYPGGAMAYFKYIDEWRNSGEFAGLEFRT